MGLSSLGVIPRGWVSLGVVPRGSVSQVQEWYHVDRLVQGGSAVGISDGGVNCGEIRRRGQLWGDRTDGSVVGRSI